VGVLGLEPAASGVTGRRSRQQISSACVSAQCPKDFLMEFFLFISLWSPRQAFTVLQMTAVSPTIKPCFLIVGAKGASQWLRVV
jgi:hypothetical protein